MTSNPTATGWKKWVGRVGNLVLDPSIVFSFDRNGYRRHQLFFDPTHLDVDLTQKTAVVTGANSGIGFATAQALAERGATVWLFCRNPERGEAARNRLIEDSGNRRVHLKIVDVSDLGVVKDAEHYADIESIDILVHNAGVLLSEPQQTSTGIEQTLATHLVGPLALTGTLSHKLKKGSRIIWVSSGGMYAQKLKLPALHHPPEPFDGVTAYAQVKRAMVIASEQLAEALGHRGIDVHCMHPGWAHTPGVKSSIPTFFKVTQAILRSPAEGADTVVWLAVAEHLSGETGGFWFDRAKRTTHLFPGTTASTTHRNELWRQLHTWAELSLNHWQEIP